MTLVYENVTTDLECILDEYIVWHSKLTLSLFYSDVEGSMSVLEVPEALPNWVKARKAEDKVVSQTVKDLLRLHDDICAQAQALLAQTSVRNAPPEHETYKRFNEIFEEFAQRLGRLEKDRLISNNGYDRVTGLRTARVMHNDIQREMDRLEREGKPFAVAMLQIDDFDILAKKSSVESLDKILEKVAGMIKLSLRSFDDAYSLGGGAFVLTLKQTESDGGVRALERLRKELEKHASDGIKLSSCIAEPVPEDDIEVLLTNLKSDIHNHESEEGGAVMEYLELTPLQRFVRDREKVS